jgi:hypothetical protein
MEEKKYFRIPEGDPRHKKLKYLEISNKVVENNQNSSGY